MDVDQGAQPGILRQMTFSTCIGRDGQCAGAVHMTRRAGLDRVGGMQIPLNQPRGRSQNLRLRSRTPGADFPDRLYVDEPVNKNAH